MTLGVDNQVIITGVIGLITTIVSGWVSWFFTKKKYNAEVDNSIIENMQKSLEFYRQLSDDNKKRLDEVLRKNAALEEEIAQLRKEVFGLMVNICYDTTCKLRKLEAEKKAKKIKKSDGAESGENI